MADATFRVLRAGPLVSIQDGGRPGWLRFGVTESGPMDRQSFAIANLALGNPAGAAGIEVSVGGLALECLSGPVTVAVAGGGFQVLLGASASLRRLGAWTVATLQAGETLTIRPGHWGNWTYLAFAGALEAPVWLGSRATLAATRLGGGLLGADDTLVIRDARARPEREGPIPMPVSARPRRSFHVVTGPQDRFFPPDAIARLLSEPFTVTSAYDRMGVRLAGPSLAPAGALDMPSEAIVRGSLQVAGDGVATVLLSDHQPTGGYPKIATLLAEDVDAFVQTRVHGQVAFGALTAEEAVRITRLRRARMATYLRPWVSACGESIIRSGGHRLGETDDAQTRSQSVSTAAVRS